MKAEDKKAADAEKEAAEKAAAEKEAADKAAADKAAKEKAKKDDDKPGIQATCVEVHSLGRYPMRLTEVGGVELHNGAVLKLPVDTAKSLCERHPGNIRMKDADGYNLKTEKVAVDYKGEVVSAGKPSPVATDKASGKASKEGEAANKNLAKAPATKG